ncbi:MAG: hypothetical protein LBI84_09235 [Propionibacteriaceae bacterium]|nr:hypothetical protein [Propionibacteriaceae bacterium]
MDWWLVIAAALAAAASLAAAAAADRRSRRRRDEILASPPARTIPGLPKDAPAPSYIRPDAAECRLAPSDEAGRAALAARLERAVPLAGGWANGRFAADPVTRQAVLAAPVVVCAAAVQAFRELWPAAAAARRRDTGLVVVAASFDASVIDALLANTAAGTMACLAVRCPSEAAVAALAAVAGGAVFDAASLRSGYLPAAALGSCDTWVSGPDSSWVLPATPPPDSAADGPAASEP